MVKIFWKLFLLAGGVVLVLGFLYSKDMISCQDAYEQKVNELESGARGYGMERLQVCELRSDAVYAFEYCNVRADAATKLPEKIRATVLSFLPALRPKFMPLESLKRQHDSDCAEYPSTQFYQDLE